MTRIPTGWFVARHDGGVHLVDRGVERLRAEASGAGRPGWGSHGAGPNELARVLLARHIGRAPSPDLAEAFADDVLAYLPRDGWVLSPSAIETWLRRVGRATTDAAAG